MQPRLSQLKETCRPQFKLSGYSFETGINLEVKKKTFFFELSKQASSLQLLLNKLIMDTSATCIRQIVQL